MNMTWTIFGAMLGIVVMLAGFCSWYVRTTVREVVREENATQLKQINGTYVRSAGAVLTGAEIDRRLVEIQNDLRNIIEQLGHQNRREH